MTPACIFTLKLLFFCLFTRNLLVNFIYIVSMLLFKNIAFFYLINCNDVLQIFDIFNNFLDLASNIFVSKRHSAILSVCISKRKSSLERQDVTKRIIELSNPGRLSYGPVLCIGTNTVYNPGRIDIVW